MLCLRAGTGTRRRRTLAVAAAGRRRVHPKRWATVDAAVRPSVAGPNRGRYQGLWVRRLEDSVEGQFPTYHVVVRHVLGRAPHCRRVNGRQPPDELWPRGVVQARAQCASVFVSCSVSALARYMRVPVSKCTGVWQCAATCNGAPARCACMFACGRTSERMYVCVSSSRVRVCMYLCMCWFALCAVLSKMCVWWCAQARTHRSPWLT